MRSFLKIVAVTTLLTLAPVAAANGGNSVSATIRIAVNLQPQSLFPDSQNTQAAALAFVTNECEAEQVINGDACANLFANHAAGFELTRTGKDSLRIEPI